MYFGLQPVPTISGYVDSAILERMAKIMSYMKVNQGKPSKKPKKKDKLAALHGLGATGGTHFPIVHGAANIMPKPAGGSTDLSMQHPLCKQQQDYVPSATVEFLQKLAFACVSGCCHSVSNLLCQLLSGKFAGCIIKQCTYAEQHMGHAHIHTRLLKCKAESQLAAAADVWKGHVVSDCMHQLLPRSSCLK